MFKEIFDSMTTGIVILDSEAKVKFLNKYMGDFVKNQYREDQQLGELFGNLFSCVHTEEKDKKCGETENCPECPLRSSLPEVSQAKQIVVFEKEFYDPDNGLRNYYGMSMKPITATGDQNILVELFQIKNSTLETISVHHENMYDKVNHYREKSYKDSLTNFYNRNFYEDKIEGIYSGLSSASLLVIDLDDLKIINDTLGHHTGDEVLKECAKIIGNIIGEKGHPIRIGGDEFLVLLDADSKEASSMAKLIMDQAREKNISFSIGQASKKEKYENFLSLFKRADEALYTAKKNGKGKLVIGY